MLAQTMVELGYKSTKADPDVWIRPAAKPERFEYYKMTLIYVDNILHLSHYPKCMMDTILASLYELKEDSLGPPKCYLGTNVGKY
jgi:hypothetical protein